MNRICMYTLGCVGLVLLTSFSVAQDTAKTLPQDAEEKANPVSVAVLTFAANDPSNPEMGVQLSEMATAVLSGNEQFSLVDRQSLGQTLAENELSLTGLVDAAEAVKIGKLVGAKILVTGRAFRMGRSNVVTAKLIGAETSRVEAVMVKGGIDSDLGELAIQLADKITECIITNGEKLTGDDKVHKDPLPALIAAIKEMKDKPVLAVVVKEEHIAGPRNVVNSAIPDPAVETEIKKILIEAGFKLQDVKQNELADWSTDDDWPKQLKGVDYIVVGEGLSEFASRIGNLVNCTARAEINMVSRANGRIVVADRATTRAVDLSENVSGKTALEKTGRILGISILQHFQNAHLAVGK